MLLIVCSFNSYGQEKLITETVSEAVSRINYAHFKTKYYSKYYSSDDTTIYEAETWVHKTDDDSILGMDIRSIGKYDYGNIETLHKGTQTWIINHDNDTITLYDQTKGEWDGFSGNILSDWTVDIPLLGSIVYDPEDSLDITKLENGNWIIHHFAGDIPDYSITNLEDWLHIDGKTYLPYRAEISWWLEGRQTYNDLHIEVIDTAKNSVLNGLHKALPDYPIVAYSPPEPELMQPLEAGTIAPKMEGYFLESSKRFNLDEYLDDHLVMIDFWYQSCGPCIKAIPYIDSLAHEYEDRGLLIFSVNSRDHATNAEVLLDFVEKRGGNKEMVIMTDSETERKAWQCNANPSFYLIKNGKIVWVQLGMSSELMTEFREQIEKNLSKK